jgi:Icc-related predicted phosphoesterase
MKLLLFSDLHCDTQAAQRLVNAAAEADIVVGAGDFGQMRHGIETTFQVLRTIDRPAVLVAGNAESNIELAEAAAAWPTAHVLHGSAVTIDGMCFFGLGGAVPVTPFGSWSVDLTEEAATKLLAACPDRCVLVTHAPPQGAVDVTSGGQNLGSTAIRDVVRKRQPVLVVCGHIHDCAGQVAYVDSTPVVNAGPAGVLWEV